MQFRALNPSPPLAWTFHLTLWRLGTWDYAWPSAHCMPGILAPIPHFLELKNSCYCANDRIFHGNRAALCQEKPYLPQAPER